jgi:hypothetical protein
VVIWYIFPVLVFCTKKSGNPALAHLQKLRRRIDFCRWTNFSFRSKVQAVWADWANFLPLGDCLHVGQLLEITEVSQSLADFLNGESYALIVAKNRLGHTFANASGHPECRSICTKNIFLCRTTPSDVIQHHLGLILLAQSFSPFSSQDGRQVRRPDPTRATNLFSKI